MVLGDVEIYDDAIASFALEAAGLVLPDAAEKVADRQRSAAPRDPVSREHLADHIVVDHHDGVADIGPDARFFYAAFLVHGTEKLAPRDFVTPSVDG